MTHLNPGGALPVDIQENVEETVQRAIQAVLPSALGKPVTRVLPRDDSP